MDIHQMCDCIIVCFQENQIEEGYNKIMQFASCIDVYTASNTISIQMQLQLKQQLILLQNLLDICDDEGVAQLFIKEIKPLLRNVIVIN
ncbi:hypothetical protein [Kurthia massiliensis]|uniref:hypothetical protein n=1 Tax=Kurthia massiliensis TaxID=1033739 RepID=UPI00028994E4|nr:hypothetical protein [Kurthia massiliensis]